MADNTVPITAGSGTAIRTVTNAGVDGGAHQQVVTLADAAGAPVAATAPLPTYAPTITASGSLTVAAQQVDGTTDLSAYQSVRIVKSGNGVVQAEASFDGTTWFNNPVMDQTVQNGNTVGWSVQLSGSGTWAGPLIGKFFRLREVVASGTDVLTVLYSQFPYVPRIVSLMASSAAIGQVSGGSVGITSFPGANTDGVSIRHLGNDAGITSGVLTANDIVIGVPSGAGTQSNAVPTASSSFNWNSGGSLNSIMAAITGTFGTNSRVVFEGTWDGSNYWPLLSVQQGVPSAVAALTQSTVGIYRVAAQGMSQIRARVTGGSTAPAISINFRNSAMPTVVQNAGGADAKDNARTAVVLSAVAVTSAVAEALITLSQWRAGTVTSATSYTVPAGKRFRIQSVQFGCRFTTPSGTVTWANARFNVRADPTGAAASVTSPLLYSDTKMAASNTATPNSDLDIPDGLELAAGTVLAVSHLDSAATLALDVLIVGFEY